MKELEEFTNRISKEFKIPVYVSVTCSIDEKYMHTGMHCFLGPGVDNPASVNGEGLEYFDTLDALEVAIRKTIERGLK